MVALGRVVYIEIEPEQLEAIAIESKRTIRGHRPCGRRRPSHPRPAWRGSLWPDITDAKSIPQELAEIVRHLPSVPVQPLLLEGSGEYIMFEHFRRYLWTLETYTYPSLERLIANLGERVIGPAEDYARSIRERCAGPRPVQVEEPSGAGGEA
jgi:hypothetical protein